jgi:hypothetical protein
MASDTDTDSASTVCAIEAAQTVETPVTSWSGSTDDAFLQTPDLTTVQRPAAAASASAAATMIGNFRAQLREEISMDEINKTAPALFGAIYEHTEPMDMATLARIFLANAEVAELPAIKDWENCDEKAIDEFVKVMDLLALQEFLGIALKRKIGDDCTVGIQTEEEAEEAEEAEMLFNIKQPKHILTH